MTAWVVLLRGVGSATQVPPRLLRATLNAEGFDGATVVGHTGNAVVRSALPQDEVAARAAAACARELGFAKPILVASGRDWAGLVAANPFPEGAAEPATLHAALLGADPEPRAVAVLDALAARDAPSRWALRGRVAYVHVPQSFSRSRLAGRIDRGLGVPNTMRSWGTVMRLLAAVEEAEAAEAAGGGRSGAATRAAGGATASPGRPIAGG